MATARERRAVFLDIDGVLAPWHRECSSVLDAASVDRVRLLARHAQIVLTSSWPEAVAREYLPIDDALRSDERRAPEAARLRGIARWLAEHSDVDRWVSIDDDHQSEWLASMAKRGERLPLDPARLILTDWRMRPRLDGERWTEAEGAGLAHDVLVRALDLLDVEAREHDRAAAACSVCGARDVEPGSVCAWVRLPSVHGRLAEAAVNRARRRAGERGQVSFW